MEASREGKLFKSIFAEHPDLRKIKLSENGLINLAGIEVFSMTLAWLDLSKNNLSILEPISALTNLTELSLEQNQITTIQALERLSRLQTLNLKGNNLCNLKDIAAIQSMNELEHLYLSGNPIELSENYPNNVFDLQPHLRSIDHWGRADCYNELHSGSHDKSVSSKDFTCTPISSLEIELQATNEAFSLQERTLAANGEELARLCASLASPRSKKSSFGADLSETEVLENFPFYRLLQTWRKQALNCTMARTLAEHALQRAHRESQRDRQKLLDRARENEAKALLWKQRSAGWEDKCHSLEQAVRDRDQRLAAAAQEAEHRDQQLFNLQQQHRNLALYLKHMKTQADQWAVLQAAEVVRGADRLRQMEGRVAAAAERVAFAAEVVAQREVQVRNSLAALDAERRLMQLTNSNPHHPHAHQDQQVCSRGADGGPQHRGDADLGSTTTTTVGAHAAAHSSAEGVRLEPEAEALLRAIFRTMDPEDTGLVSVQLLIKCLVAETEAAKATLLQSHQHREHKEAESEGEEGEEGEDDDGLPSSTAAAAVAGVAVPTALGDMVRSAVGSVQWKRLVSALQALSRNNPHNNLTWGEFLLQFIPAPAPASRAGAGANGVISSPNAGSLTAAELRDLRKAGLLGDMDWGLIPLQLPTQLSAAAGGSGGSAGSNATIHQLQKQDHHSSPTSSRNRSPEHRQLLAERRYLMQRLQDMTRTLERRAEGIKAYFEGTIRREQLKDERKATQISELQHTLAVTQARQAELEQLLAHSKAQYDSRVPQLEAQVVSLQESMRATHREVVEKYEATLLAEANKVATLESRVEGLKRDCSNRDIKRRALESDLRRLSESNKTAMGEISSLKEKLTLAQQQVKEQERAQEQVQQALLLQEQSALDCEVRLLKARETWEAERAAATAELEQLRRELEVCRVKVAESEGQVGAGADVHSAEVNPTATAALSSANLSPTAAVAQDEDVLLRQEQVRRLQAEVHQLHNAIAAARSGPSAVNKPAPAGSPAALALPHPTSADRGHHHAGPPAGASATQAHLDSVLRRLEQVLS